MTEVAVEFLGGPLDGTTGSVRTSHSGRPPQRYTVDLSTRSGSRNGKHDYRVGEPPRAGDRWRYVYRGILPG